MSYNSNKEVFNELKNNLKKGKILQMDVDDPKEKEGFRKINKNKYKNKKRMKCDFDECDKQIFEYGDNLIIFKECNHCFHKDCFNNIKNIYSSEKNKYYIDNNFCPKCFEIV